MVPWPACTTTFGGKFLVNHQYRNFLWRHVLIKILRVGNILAGWTTYGTELHYATSWAWRVPTIVQAALPAVVMCLIMFFPESPRWLIHQDRTEEALSIFAKYHGDGDANSPLVQLQYREIVEEAAATHDPNPWWNFKELVNTRAARYRFAMVIGMSFFGQWSGNNVVSYFMPSMIASAGIHDTSKQLLINAVSFGHEHK